MPVFELPDEIAFPHPSLAEPDGLLAVGGDLSPERLLCAYQNGIYPWYNPNDPILWWSPAPRCVLFPEKFRLSKSLKTIIRKEIFTIKFNSNFEAVIANCANVARTDGNGTWINEHIITAYIRLFQMGWAHSAEAYLNNKLVGGLYGIGVGNVFFGESMFHTEPNASKVAFWNLCQQLKNNGTVLIDCQMTTKHLLSLGAEVIEREIFLSILERNAKFEKMFIRNI